MEKLKPYPKYKAVDLPWLKEIPVHWEILRAKKLFSIFDERSKDGDESLLSVSSNYGVVNRNSIDVTMFKAESYVGYKLCYPQDLVVNSLWAWAYGLGFSEQKGIISTAYSVYRLRNCQNTYYLYYNYLLRSSAYHWEFRVRSKGIWKSRYQLHDSSFMNIPIILPPPDEQKKIVAFLDEKTAKIDKYIEAKSKEIELLKEQKNAEISNAVTRGLNPNTKFKPVNLPWLKEIPAHWSLRSLRQIASEYFISNKYIKEQNLLSLSYGKIIKKDINITEGLLPLSFDTYQVVEKGNVIIRPTDLQNDHRSLRVGLARERGIITSAYIAIEPSHELCPEYLYYLLHTYDLHKEFYRMGGGMRQSLKWRELRKLNFYIPSLDEQKKIVAFLDDKTKKYTKAISAIQRKIDLLKEYKTRLISDAVT